MSLTPYIRAMGRGPSRARSLEADEAQDAMRQILDGTAEPAAVGALLMLMRYRGESPGEIAGFTRAVRDALPVWSGPQPALDWPSLAAGRSRGLPWFLLSARLVAEAGHPVLLHGWNSARHQGEAASVAAALPHLGIAIAADMGSAGELLARRGIVYLPLESYAPKVLEVLQLRDILGLRSAMNTVARMVNPGAAPTLVQGVFHPPYLQLQQAAAAILGQPNLAIIKGGGGEFERNPAKDVPVSGLRGNAAFEIVAPELLAETSVRLAEGPELPLAAASLTALWSGAARDIFAEAIVCGTAGLALMALGAAPDVAAADALARQLWETRDRRVAA
ncbi:glycosyl transferase family protein [Tropicimonas sp. IMCC34043]|uniref:glycosyl transferase family protein n=1 Tax=Tropicimonas sp. IMCC34043 TaxID=2248760 RepID=UPI000E24FE26|nr:glycosyl transferase family protein [Tropicimonas sp. IMCC34043]